MAKTSEAVKVTPTQIKNAQTMWHNFIVGGKITIIATIIILLLLALAFVDFSAVNSGGH